MKRFLVQNGFVLGILGTVALAWADPGIGSRDGPLPVGVLKAVGIFGVFFFQGLSLPFEELRRGAANCRLHLCVQGTTFVFFPLAVAAGLALFSGWLDQPDLRAGFLYLSFLPSTIASALALSGVARRNVSSSLLNKTLSNGVGVFLVPFLCIAWIGGGSAGGPLPVGPVLLGIFLKIILPLLLGQAGRSFAGAWAARHRPAIRRFANGVILFIVYAAFCDSFRRDVWTDVEPVALGITGTGVAILLLAATGFSWLLSGRAGLDAPSRATALFCGSQKTLAVGLPLSVMIFGAEESGFELGVLIVPLLLYHPAQLVLHGWIAPRLAAKRTAVGSVAKD